MTVRGSRWLLAAMVVAALAPACRPAASYADTATSIDPAVRQALDRAAPTADIDVIVVLRAQAALPSAMPISAGS